MERLSTCFRQTAFPHLLWACTSRDVQPNVVSKESSWSTDLTAFPSDPGSMKSNVVTFSVMAMVETANSGFCRKDEVTLVTRRNRANAHGAANENT